VTGLRVSLLQQPLVWQDPAGGPTTAWKFPAQLDADRFTFEP
jgi:hypothetical protein